MNLNSISIAIWLESRYWGSDFPGTLGTIIEGIEKFGEARLGFFDPNYGRK